MAVPSVALAKAVQMPLVGFGTWQLRGRGAYQAVRYALDVGYRHIDTATIYRNEAEIGQALQDSGVPRSEVFITTKLWPTDAGRERRTIAASLKALGTDYVDLWLVHWPPRRGAAVSVWKEFVEVHRDGLARTIGVSNFDAAQIDELTRATGVTPSVDQIEWSPRRYDRSVADALRARGVVLEGYSPFKTSRLNDPVLVEIAARHDVTAAQVVLRWHVDHGFVVIPKSAHQDRIAANFDVFDFSLDPAEVARIDALGSG
ncbi:MAG TPA: aldo/keto reductase [Jiangellaceae bacterium]|jgi:2,5-diketo-D-gluconate reductase A